MKRTGLIPHTRPRYAHPCGRDADLTILRGACEMWCKLCVWKVCGDDSSVVIHPSIQNSAIGLTAANSCHCYLPPQTHTPSIMRPQRYLVRATTAVGPHFRSLGSLAASTASGVTDVVAAAHIGGLNTAVLDNTNRKPYTSSSDTHICLREIR